MSVEAMAIALHHSQAKGTAKVILLGIANHMGDGGAWPSLATLARYANCSERHAQRAIAALVAAREISVDPQAGGAGPMADYLRPNRYVVLLSCPQWCDRTAWHRDTRTTAGRQRALFGQPRLSTTVEKLSTDRVTPASPGDTRVTPPVTPASPETYLETTSLTVSSQVQDARARDARRCSTCGQPEDGCLTRQLRLAAEDRHDYTPATGSS